jgi:membrane protein YdbS with pleckstrin-like domain
MAKTAVGKKSQIKAALPLLLSLAAALLIWLGGVNPVWVILATIVITLFTEWIIIRNS